MNFSIISTAVAQTLSTATSSVTALAANAASNAAAANPYGLGAIWSQGDWVAKGCLLLLAIMSIASWTVLVSKTIELRKLKAHAASAHASFQPIHHFGANLTKLAVDNPLRFCGRIRS